MKFSKENKNKDLLQQRDDAMDAEDWKTMYKILFYAICDVLGPDWTSKDEIKDYLMEASQRAEDYYINVADAVLGWPEQKRP